MLKSVYKLYKIQIEILEINFGLKSLNKQNLLNQNLLFCENIKIKSIKGGISIGFPSKHTSVNF